MTGNNIEHSGGTDNAEAAMLYVWCKVEDSDSQDDDIHMHISGRIKFL